MNAWGRESCSISGPAKTTGTWHRPCSEILEGGVGGSNLETIDSCIWSHYHYDHCGNMSLLLRLGMDSRKPGCFQANPDNPEFQLLASDFENRRLTEVKFESDLKIGGFSCIRLFWGWVTLPL